jgi:hypothetical protein
LLAVSLLSPGFLAHVPAQDSEDAGKMIIEISPDIDQSEVIRNVVESLEEKGVAKRAEVDRVGKPVTFEAFIQPRPDMPHERVLQLIETLRGLGIDRLSFRVGPPADNQESSVIVQCPADVTWRTVRSLTEGLQQLKDFKADVRVAANLDPVTPVRTDAMPTPPKATDSVLNVYRLQTLAAPTAARILERLFRGEFGDAKIVSDDSTNSLIVRASASIHEEIEALLSRLDRSDGLPGKPQPNEVGPPVNRAVEPAPIASDGVSGPLKGPHQGGEGKNQVFSFYYGTAGESVADLRKGFRELDAKACGIAARLRQPVPDSGSGDALRNELRKAVQEAFVARQKLQRAELAEFAQRLHRIQQSIEVRDRISSEIVDRRVEELLDPNLQWDETTIELRSPAASASKPGADDSKRHGPNSGSGANTRLDHSEPSPDVIRQSFGARFEVVRQDELQASRYRGGLKITELHSGGPAERAGLRVGDILVGVDRWETMSLDNLHFAWQQTTGADSVKIYVVRPSAHGGSESMFGRLKWDEGSGQSRP